MEPYGSREDDVRRLPRFLVAGLAALSGLAIGAVSSARAQAPSFPTKGKAITIIVPYAAGGVADTGARLIAAGLEKEFGTPSRWSTRLAPPRRSA